MQVFFKSLRSAILLAGLLTASTAGAAVTVTYQQIGGNVIATSDGGTFNLDALTLASTAANTSPGINPSGGAFIIGEADLTDRYSGFTSFGAFGTGGGTGATSGTGDIFGAAGSRLAVPTGYTSGALIGPSTATFVGASYQSLGLSQGTFVWSWGSGASADTLTMVVTAIPEPSASMLGVIGGLLLLRRRR